LSIIIAERMSELEEQYLSMKKEALDCVVRLKASEEKVMKGLAQNIEEVIMDTSIIQNL